MAMAMAMDGTSFLSLHYEAWLSKLDMHPKETI
jgi:hypothetical protein